MDEEQWRQMEFPEAEALVLYFTAENGYCIPTFLGTMKKLKILIINNHSARRATLSGLNSFEKLSQLKTLQLERLRVPPPDRYFNCPKNLVKLSLSLCEGLGDMVRLDKDNFFNFPGLLEFNADHCSDLEELPRGICSSNSLKLLLVRNCHQLSKLPDELGRLRLLEVLSLCACASLEVLPQSILNLQKLEILDVSHCVNLKVFPDRFHELSSLKQLDMGECRKLPQFCGSLPRLRSLNHVICSEKNEQQLKRLRNVSFNVEVVEEQFGLDWLYDR
ncbi:probable disease resistance protein At4g33300 [Cryptomeria japonica]|uniref:probable disease resistance protein At4g33300 n=1 Tax=Cryptomeria japonica TaxID=3369 RepID=UPI0027DA2455|nr:probable disease resistance protein At4g33300 [Cryptomeria japonica]